ncbi:MAG: MOSC domain-containing protein [Planktomarina sp.]
MPKADGRWYSTRNYIVNLLYDNLLKYSVTSNRGIWTLVGPDGQRLIVDPGNLDAVTPYLGTFLAPVLKPGMSPSLVDREAGEGPKGFWDFKDSELLILNLETLRAVERHWGIRIDPRRFRANLLLDDLPAWSEFGLYGSELQIGQAKINILRPARRCSALSANPDSGEKDVPVHHMLSDDFGHGFFGVYARVTQAGDIAVGDSGQITDAERLPFDQISCDGAPDIALWPKTVSVSPTAEADVVKVTPLGPLRLAPADFVGRMKIHVDPDNILRCEIVGAEGAALLLRLSQPYDLKNLPSGTLYVTGPYGGRRA